MVGDHFLIETGVSYTVATPGKDLELLRHEMTLADARGEARRKRERRVLPATPLTSLDNNEEDAPCFRLLELWWFSVVSSPAI